VVQGSGTLLHGLSHFAAVATRQLEFQVEPVFLVAVLDFKYDEAEERQKLYRHVMHKDQDGEQFTDKVQMVFLQMPLFTKTESELETQKDKWLFFLKNLESFETIPAILREPIFEKAFATAEYVRYSPAVQETYQNDLKAYRDNINVLETAKIEGEAIGEAKGRAEGRVEGRTERDIEIAQGMKQKGYAVEAIVELTGLLQEDVEKL